MNFKNIIVDKVKETLSPENIMKNELKKKAKSMLGSYKEENPEITKKEEKSIEKKIIAAIKDGLEDFDVSSLLKKD